MELKFSELRQRDVINVPDGRNLGRIIDLRIEFPKGELSGIVVPGHRQRKFFSCFNKSELYINSTNIIKIGGDVILVDITSCNHKKPRPQPCPPPCPPQRPCSPQNNNTNVNAQGSNNFLGINVEDVNIDLGDY